MHRFQRLEAFCLNRMVSPQAIRNADLAYWRARILFLLVFSGMFIGLFVFIPVSILAVKEKMWGLLVFDALVWMSGIFLLVSRRLTYFLRAGIVVLLVYALGVVVTVSVGPLSGGPAWLFTFAVLVAVLMGAKAAVAALGLNALTLALIGWLIGSGTAERSFPFFSTNEAMMAAGANFLLLNAMVSISVAVLVKGLVSTHQRQTDLTAALEEERENLLTSKAKIQSEIEERRQTEELLKTSEKKYRFIADNVSDNIWTMDLDMNFTYVSPSVLRIRGYTAEEAIHHQLKDIMPQASLDVTVTALAEELESHRRGMKPPDKPRKVEIELYHKDGFSVWCEVEANFIYDSSGEPTGIIGATRDITERKQTVEQLLRSEKLATLGDMVAGVAHEISTPLGVGLMSASFLSEKTREFNELLHSMQPRSPEIAKYSGKIREAADMVVANLERAAMLLNSFKNVAVDQLVEERRLFNIRTNIEDTVNTLRPRYKRTDHIITIDCPVDLMIDSYPGAFSQITTNLIINSLIHGFENLEKGNISITIDRKKDHLLYTYRDTGKGMDEKTLQRMFDPFFTTKRNRGGIGLGMHVVHNLVCRTLKGRIESESAVGAGTRFIITVPLH
ncbi:MAG: PAS domain S-box protein [Thermodesulfobacteriota bacterium]